MLRGKTSEIMRSVLALRCERTSLEIVFIGQS